VNAEVEQLRKQIRQVQLDRDQQFQRVTELTDQVQQARTSQSRPAERDARGEQQLAMEKAARREALAALENRARQLSEQLAQLEARNAQLVQSEREAMTAMESTQRNLAAAKSGEDAVAAGGSSSVAGIRADEPPTPPTTGTPVYPVSDPVLPAGYASLTVDLAFEGKPVVFRSPRQGDITARSVKTASMVRLWQIGQVLIALLALLVVYRLLRYIGPERLTGYVTAALLLILGLLSLLTGIFPVAGLIAVATAIVLFIRRLAQRRPRRSRAAAA
jgi:hypothetical protein